MKVYIIELGSILKKDQPSERFCSFFFPSTIFYSLNQIDTLFLHLSPPQLTVHLHSALSKAPKDFMKDTKDVEYVSARVLLDIANNVGCTPLSHLCQLTRDDLLGNKAGTILQQISGFQPCVPKPNETEIETVGNFDATKSAEEQLPKQVTSPTQNRNEGDNANNSQEEDKKDDNRSGDEKESGSPTSLMQKKRKRSNVRLPVGSGKPSNPEVLEQVRNSLRIKQQKRMMEQQRTGSPSPTSSPQNPLSGGNPKTDSPGVNLHSAEALDSQRGGRGTSNWQEADRLSPQSRAPGDFPATSQTVPKSLYSYDTQKLPPRAYSIPENSRFPPGYYGPNQHQDVLGRQRKNSMPVGRSDFIHQPSIPEHTYLNRHRTNTMTAVRSLSPDNPSKGAFLALFDKLYDELTAIDKLKSILEDKIQLAHDLTQRLQRNEGMISAIVQKEVQHQMQEVFTNYYRDPLARRGSITEGRPPERQQAIPNTRFDPRLASRGMYEHEVKERARRASFSEEGLQSKQMYDVPAKFDERLASLEKHWREH